MLNSYELNLLRGYMRKRGIPNYKHSYGTITFIDALGHTVSVRDLQGLMTAAEREAIKFYADNVPISNGANNVD